VMTTGLSSSLVVTGEFSHSYFDIHSEGPEKATRGGVKGSQSKFLEENWPMSQVQTPKPKPYKNVMNTPTNSVDKISQRYERSGKRMR
jgi:hypothetical protein